MALRSTTAIGRVKRSRVRDRNEAHHRASNDLPSALKPGLTETLISTRLPITYFGSVLFGGKLAVNGSLFRGFGTVISLILSHIQRRSHSMLYLKNVPPVERVLRMMLLRVRPVLRSLDLAQHIQSWLLS